MIDRNKILEEIQTPVVGWIEQVGMKTVTAAISNPPTAAEIEAAFGTAASMGDGYRALLLETGAARAWVCVSDGASWWYMGLTKAA